MKQEFKARLDCRDCDNGEIIDRILYLRNIDDINNFLSPTEDDLLPLDSLKNIDEAYRVVEYAIDKKLKIHIHFDSDCDGCTSGAIMKRYLANFTNNIEVSINQGKEHGIENLESDADLLIVVDSINKATEYDKFTDNGTKVIILDHHIPPSNIEEYSNVCLVSSAVDYPNPELSGAGVVWKFCKYIDYMWLTDYADDLVDLAACGIIADMCDISVPENRAICNMGLSNPQSLAIKQINGSYPFNAQAVGFGIAPLINAAQRLRKNRSALDLFLSDDVGEVKKLVKELKTCKEEQAEIVEMLMPEILEQAQDQIGNKVICVVIETEADVSGLLGNKLSSIYQRPVLILKDCGENYFGSGRGYGVEDFMSVINETGLARADGHPNAFGVQIRKECIEELLTELNNAYADVEFEIKVEADVLITPDQIDDVLIQNFKACDRISGKGFKPLTVMIQSVDEYIAGEMSKGRHLKLDFGDFLAIKWNFDGDRTPFEENKRIDIVGTLTSGYFGRTFYRQLIIQDWRVSE